MNHFYKLNPFCLAVAMLVTAVSTEAMACGGYYRNQLLEERNDALARLPSGSFHLEMQRHGVMIEGLATVTDATINPSSIYYDFDEYESSERTPSEQEALREAFEQKQLTSSQWQIVQHMRGMDNAEEAELAGGDLADELRFYTAGAVAFWHGDYDSAQNYFQKVLALPPAQRTLRTTWAQYSLARSLAKQQQWESARNVFQELRSGVKQGNADPLELAVASLGEEALVAMHMQDWAAAAELYGSQFAHGSESGYTSLLTLSHTLLSLSDEELAFALQKPPVQKLLAAYLFSGFEFNSEQVKRVASMFSLLDESSASHLDLLAAVSYQYGEFDTAKKFVKLAADTGLTWWLRAKLALRDGDVSAAQDAYANAAKKFPLDESWGYESEESYDAFNPQCRVKAESSILFLKSGDYAEALHLLMQSADYYWTDAAFVAERVLTVDELKAFVESHRYPAGPHSERGSFHAETELRLLLGRRLMRVGRYEEAAPFFEKPELRQLAEEYSTARKQIDSSWTDIGRAEAKYVAGKILRQYGMELTGFELAPDFNSYGGMFDATEKISVGDWLSKDEFDRTQRHIAVPEKRFHYRYAAAALLNSAADDVSPRTQAFASLLCKATGFLLYRDGEAAAQYYQRYVDEGPYLEWADEFGQVCPEPDFSAARDRQWHEFVLQWRLTLRPYKWIIYGGGVALLFGAVFVLRRFRIRKS